jgi:hypothetical protein
MSELIEKIDFKLKENECGHYFEYIEDYDKYFIVTRFHNDKLNEYTYIFKLFELKSNNEQILYRLNMNKSSSILLNKVKDNKIIFGKNSYYDTDFTINYMFRNNYILISGYNNTIIVNIETNDIIFEFENIIEYIHDNLLFLKKNITQNPHSYDIYIFNMDNHVDKTIKCGSFLFPYNESRRKRLIRSELNNLFPKNINIFNDHSSHSFNYFQHSLVTFDKRFIFIRYKNKRITLYDTLNNEELRDSVIYDCNYMNDIDTKNASIVIRTEFGSHQIISFRKYIDKIYENERIEAEKALNPPKIEEKSVETIQQIVEKDVKSSSRNSYSIEITNVSDNNETNVVEATVVEEFSDLHPIHKVDYSDDRWMRKNEWKRCTLCYKNFGLFVRKNHCRSCGRLACSACSNFIGKGKIIAGMPISVQNKIKAHKDVKLCIRCHSHEMKDN